jgi:spore maturation protein SpmA
MGELQELNPDKETASNDQILFLVINTSAVTLIPITIFVYRAQLGAADPTDVFIPLIIATFCSTMAGLVVTAAVQRLRLLDPVIMAYLGAMTLAIGSLVFYFSRLPREVMERQSSLISNIAIFGVIVAFLFLAARRRVPLYETFVEGAKDGFKVAVGIIPYLVAMLVAIGVFRASGALDWLLAASSLLRPMQGEHHGRQRQRRAPATPVSPSLFHQPLHPSHFTGHASSQARSEVSILPSRPSDRPAASVIRNSNSSASVAKSRSRPVPTQLTWQRHGAPGASRHSRTR